MCFVRRQRSVPVLFPCEILPSNPLIRGASRYLCTCLNGLAYHNIIELHKIKSNESILTTPRSRDVDQAPQTRRTVLYARDQPTQSENQVNWDRTRRCMRVERSYQSYRTRSSAFTNAAEASSRASSHTQTYSVAKEENIFGKRISDTRYHAPSTRR